MWSCEPSDHYVYSAWCSIKESWCYGCLALCCIDLPKSCIEFNWQQYCVKSCCCLHLSFQPWHLNSWHLCLRAQLNCAAWMLLSMTTLRLTFLQRHWSWERNPDFHLLLSITNHLFFDIWFSILLEDIPGKQGSNKEEEAKKEQKPLKVEEEKSKGQVHGKKPGRQARSLLQFEKQKHLIWKLFF